MESVHLRSDKSLKASDGSIVSRNRSTYNGSTSGVFLWSHIYPKNYLKKATNVLISWDSNGQTLPLFTEKSSITVN